MLKIKEFSDIFIKESYYSVDSKVVRFLPYYYDLIGLNEELVELEEEIVDKSNNLELILGEYSDVLFYMLRFSNHFKINFEEIERLKHNISINSLLDFKSILLYNLRKNLGKLNGLTKKNLRAGQIEINEAVIINYILDFYTILFKLGKVLGFEIDSVLNYALDKFRKRNKEAKEKLEKLKPKKEKEILKD